MFGPLGCSCKRPNSTLSYSFMSKPFSSTNGSPFAMRRSTELYKSLLRESWERFAGGSMMLIDLTVRLKEQRKLQQRPSCEFLHLNNKICVIQASQSIVIFVGFYQAHGGNHQFLHD